MAKIPGLRLYHFVGCSYCYRVMSALRRLGIEIELRDIHQDQSFREELVRGGGKSQVPCLRIEETGGSVRWMYESVDIIKYLEDYKPLSPQ